MTIDPLVTLQILRDAADITAAVEGGGTVTLDFRANEILINPPPLVPRNDEALPERDGHHVNGGTWEFATDDTAPIGGSLSTTVYYDET